MEPEATTANESGELSDDWIEKHNDRVANFDAELYRVLDAMTDGQCREVVAMAKEEGLAMNQIAERMRAPLGGKWADSEHVWAGIDIYQTALSRLDEYDDDFRPRPARIPMETTGDGAEIFYLAADGVYEVVVAGRSARFKAGFNAEFGMDVSDAARAEDIARKFIAGAPQPRPKE